jgi:hypothetical protein
MKVDNLSSYKKINIEAITKNTKNAHAAFKYAKEAVKKQLIY